MHAVNVDELLGALAQSRSSGADVATTSLNIVGFVEEDEVLLVRLQQRIEELGGKYACRSVVLSASRDPADHSIKGDQIELGARDLSAAELRSVTHDLLVPGVRTVLLWGGVHLTDERFTGLSELADPIVIVSSARQAGLEALRELIGLEQSDHRAAPKLRDLSYLRLYAWQDLIAQFFDDPELAAELPSLTAVRVTAGSLPEAYYLAGWLASRLHWEVCGENEFCNSEGGKIRVELTQAGPPRRIQSACLKSKHNVFTAAIDRTGDDIVCLTVEGRNARPRRCRPLHDVDMLSLVERAIFEPPKREIYSQTLVMVERLLEHAR